MLSKIVSGLLGLVVGVQIAFCGAAGCISDLVAFPKNSQVQLYWTAVPGADHYNVYRGTFAGGPYAYVGNTAYSFYLDNTVANGIKYYYVVRSANVVNVEQCQSNEASTTPNRPRLR